jgi:hypothetical protein
MLLLISATLASAHAAKGAAIFCTRTTALDETIKLIKMFPGHTVKTWPQKIQTIQPDYRMNVTWFAIKFFDEIDFC